MPRLAILTLLATLALGPFQVGAAQTPSPQFKPQVQPQIELRTKPLISPRQPGPDAAKHWRTTPVSFGVIAAFTQSDGTFLLRRRDMELILVNTSSAPASVTVSCGNVTIGPDSKVTELQNGFRYISPRSTTWTRSLGSSEAVVLSIAQENFPRQPGQQISSVEGHCVIRSDVAIVVTSEVRTQSFLSRSRLAPIEFFSPVEFTSAFVPAIRLAD